MQKLRKIFSILGTILLVLLIAIVILIFNARFSGEAPNIFGYQVFRVITPSMEPELMVSDVILVKEIDPSEVEIYDIVTYKGEVGDFSGKIITHKVVAPPEIVDGKYVFTTKGVANGATLDPQWDEDQLLGVYVRKIPYVNKLYNFFLQPYGLLIIIFVIVALFGYELISLIVSYKRLDYDDEDDESIVEDNDKDDIKNEE